jgi:hypothetical protein
MSAPKTNIDRQVSRHRGPLLGMMAVGGFVAILILGWLFYESSGRDATEVVPADASADGTETPVEPAATAPAAPETDAPVTTPTTPAPTQP